MAEVGRGSNRDSKIGDDISHHTVVGQTELTFGWRTKKNKQGEIIGVLKDADDIPIKRPLYYNHVQTQDIETTMFEAAGTWAEQASVTMDGLFVPYGGVFASGEINRKAGHAGVGGPAWEN